MSRLLLGVLLLAGGVLIGLYGLFAILYNGDCQRDCGNVYVTFFGRQMNANMVGGVALAVALALLFTSVWFLRRRDSRSVAH